MFSLFFCELIKQFHFYDQPKAARFLLSIEAAVDQIVEVGSLNSQLSTQAFGFYLLFKPKDFRLKYPSATWPCQHSLTALELFGTLISTHPPITAERFNSDKWAALTMVFSLSFSFPTSFFFSAINQRSVSLVLFPDLSRFTIFSPQQILQDLHSWPPRSSRLCHRS